MFHHAHNSHGAGATFEYQSREVLTKEPGLASASKAVFLGPRYQNQAFEPGFLINPFTEDRGAVTYEKPVICISCGGFLNLYCELDHTNGRWTCNLCGEGNFTLDLPNAPCSNEADRLKRFPQLQSKHVDFVEDVYRSSSAGVSSTGRDYSSVVYLFAIDDTLCNVASDIKKFLTKVLSSVPQNHRVGIICYGKCLSLFRLCGGISQSVAVDVLPGDGDATHTIDHFIAQGVYLTPASKALEEVGRIAKTLYLLANEGSGQAGRRHGDMRSGPEPVASIEAIVSTASALGNVSGDPAVRLFIVAGRSIPHVRASLEAAHGVSEGSLSDGTREARHVSAYAKLGRHALFPPRAAGTDGGGGCWIDLVRVGCRSIRTDTLEALCGSSGGMVYRSFTLADDHMLDSVGASLRLTAAHFPRGGTLCTLELRSSPGLQISHIIGPVLSREDAIDVPGARLDLASVDIRHMHQETIDKGKMHEFVEITGKHSSNTIHVNKKAFQKLYKYNEQNTLICGLTRLDPNTTVSVQCSTTAEAQHRQRAGLQCVVRYSIDRNHQSGPSNSEYSQEIIRVMNVQLTCTDDKDLYLQSLDSELWSLLMARSIVADFHVAQIEFESIRALQFRSNREDDLAATVATPRDAGLRDIETLVRDVLQQWCPLSNESELGKIGSEAAEMTARTLYHLWLGPLLGGPSMDAFLLRSHFLAIPARHALKMLRPHIVIEFEPSAEELRLGGQEKEKEERLPESGSQVVDMALFQDKEAMATVIKEHTPPKMPPPPSSNDAIMPPNFNGDNTTPQLLPVADSLWLLPGAIIVLDMGYMILIWDGGPLLKTLKNNLESKRNGSASPEVTNSEHNVSVVALHAASLKRTHQKCLSVAQQRHPVAEVTIVVGGTPGERLAFSSMSPSHMDSNSVILATGKHLAGGKWGTYINSMIERSPHTDQQSFAMFLIRVSPAHGNEWCRMGSLIPLTEEDRQLKALQPVPLMDRGLMLGPAMDIIDVL